MSYIALDRRYDTMKYNYVGKSGLQLPAVSLGLWQNFGSAVSIDHITDMLTTAFDLGITHFDLANNYGPIAGSAEANFGKVMSTTLSAYRDELVISSKAGFDMWQGPYGNFGSKKYLVASLDQSLLRMGLSYVDIFYHHRYDPNTPLEEVAHTLDLIIRQGKALYCGVSNYPADKIKQIGEIFKRQNTPFIIEQPKYNMLDRKVEREGLFDVIAGLGIGSICYSPLARGQLTSKYLNVREEDIKDDIIRSNMRKIRALNSLAESRGQTLAQFALSWILNNPVITSVIIGASSAVQLTENCKAIDKLSFDNSELKAIDSLLMD